MWLLLPKRVPIFRPRRFLRLVCYYRYMAEKAASLLKWFGLPWLVGRFISSLNVADSERRCVSAGASIMSWPMEISCC